ncbi:MAG: hypothetical protein K2H53_01640, partial [Clostridia bacterium]|nr:hypothetical protein [Clostridia bacterium]
NGENSQTAILDSLISKSIPPIPKHFKIFARNENGFFIINERDQSVFKWIDPEKLECNGIDGKGKLSRSGRRNFQGMPFHADFSAKGYYESNDSGFKKSIKDFGGYYVSVWKARKNGINDIASFSGDGEIVDLITFPEAKEQAESYAKQYAENGEFISEVPCGAAMDCVFEEIFERFYKELLKIGNETEYEAWNRYAELKRNDFMTNGIYGIYDLIGSGEEMTSEGQTNIELMVAVRCGERGLDLIAHNERYQTPRKAYFALGHRNFKASEYRVHECGYRIVLFPQKQN